MTVEATDAITKTPVDRENGKYPDVYQLNEITLTATVAAAKGARCHDEARRHRDLLLQR